MKKTDVNSQFWQLEEAECAQAAVERLRMRSLSESIDSLSDRISDCEKLIAEGKIDHKYTFETMVKPQVERIVEAKNRVLDTGSLPSVISLSLPSEVVPGRRIPPAHSDRPNQGSPF